MRSRIFAIVGVLGVVGAALAAGALHVRVPEPVEQAAALAAIEPQQSSTASLILAGAEREVSNRTRYLETYQVLAYPGGDVPADIGVCTDLVVRAFRNAGVDLQKNLHEDRVAHPEAYPTDIWERKAADRNIDHRRCQNLRAYFARFARPVAPGDPSSWRPGDVIFFARKGAAHPWHVGILADGKRERPRMVHLYPPICAADFVDRYGPVHSIWRWPE